MKKRNILTVALALCLIAIMACGTLAYFTSTKTVTNVFKTSAVPGTGEDKDNDGEPDVTPEDIFSIKVTETNNNPDDDDTTDDSTTTSGNIYEDVLPGTTFTKDPTVTNTGAYGAYVRVSVTVSNAADWKRVCEKHNITDLESIFGGFEAAKWTRYDDPVLDTKNDTDEKNDTLTYVYYLNAELLKGESANLFKTVTIPTCLDTTDMLALKEFSLTVKADAIQAGNTNDPDGKVPNPYYAFSNFWEE